MSVGRPDVLRVKAPQMLQLRNNGESYGTLCSRKTDFARPNTLIYWSFLTIWEAALDGNFPGGHFQEWGHRWETSAENGVLHTVRRSHTMPFRANRFPPQEGVCDFRSVQG
jgi:hypothetical protein